MLKNALASVSLDALSGAEGKMKIFQDEIASSRAMESTAIDQDGWTSAKFFWTEMESKSRRTPEKKKRGHYPAILTEQAWPKKALLYGRSFCVCRFLLQNKLMKLFFPLLL